MATQKKKADIISDENKEKKSQDTQQTQREEKDEELIAPIRTAYRRIKQIQTQISRRKNKYNIYR